VVKEIKTDDYRIWYDSTIETVTCQGSFRLTGMQEYAPIVELLNEAATQESLQITLDVRDLEFLNSSGINVLSKFVINIRQQKTKQITVRGSDDIPWQEKSLRNLQRLMPSLQLEME